MRKLASIQMIEKLSPIPGAENIEVATILGWKCVVKKREFKEGDLCVYFEIDSMIPKREWSYFLFKEGHDKPHRLKTIKLRGQISQGLALPLNELDFLVIPEKNFMFSPIGADLTDALSIGKYEKQIPAQLRGQMKGDFPSLIPKTDEPRIQSNPELFDEWLKCKSVYATVKMDGSSMTCYLIDGKFGVCSRNVELKEEGGSTYWEVAKKLKIEDIMREYADIEKSLSGEPNFDFAFQGELCGPGIQGNKMGLKNHDFFIFNIYSIKDDEYIHPYSFFHERTDSSKIRNVPYLDISNNSCKVSFLLKNDIKHISSIEDLFEISSKVTYENGSLAEGVVWRGYKGKGKIVSFKTINNEYLLNEK